MYLGECSTPLKNSSSIELREPHSAGLALGLKRGFTIEPTKVEDFSKREVSLERDPLNDITEKKIIDK